MNVPEKPNKHRIVFALMDRTAKLKVFRYEDHKPQR